jgi:hypothetical protein
MELPSSNVSKLLIGVVLIVSIFISGDLIIKKFKNNGQLEVVDADLILQRKTTDNTSVDKDNDGLLDWQETLYGTDPTNPDSDGDKTVDGEEIKLGRDPNLAGPNDKLLKMSDLIDTEIDKKGYTPGSLTDQLSIELFNQYINLKKDSNLNSDTGFKLVDDMTQKAITDSKIENKYSINDLKSVESTKNNLQDYAESFANTHIDYLKQMQNLALLPEKAYIPAIAVKYMEFAKALSELDVPDVAINVHIQIVNKTYNKGVLLLEIIKEETDPVRSLLGIQKLKVNEEGEYELYTSLSNYFRNNGIIFEDNNIIRFWKLYE